MKTISIKSRSAGFTLIELIVSMGIMLMLMLVLVSITDATQKTWTNTTGKVEQFRAAKDAFEALTRRISQATLNTYYDYDSPTTPTKYQRQSELRFISGPNLAGKSTSTPPRPTHSIFFQAPLGFFATTSTTNPLDVLPNLLNTWGFYLEFGSDKTFRPDFINNMTNPPPDRYRFRLVEMMEPSELQALYSYTSGKPTYTGLDWFTAPLGNSSVPKRAIAENVIALMFLPKLSPSDIAGLNKAGGKYTDASLAPAYLYDSTGTGMTTTSDANLNPKNQLPPVVRVTMVAIDEASAARWQNFYGTSAPDTIQPQWFTDASQYDTDLGWLKRQLNGEFDLKQKANYRIFTTEVSIKAAKWSRAQTN